jgi:hypothetical protein
MKKRFQKTKRYRQKLSLKTLRMVIAEIQFRTALANKYLELARPKPKFQLGAPNHPGGVAVVGEFGPERIILPHARPFYGHEFSRHNYGLEIMQPPMFYGMDFAKPGSNRTVIGFYNNGVMRYDDITNPYELFRLTRAMWYAIVKKHCMKNEHAAEWWFPLIRSIAYTVMLLQHTKRHSRFLDHQREMLELNRLIKFDA